MRAHHWCNADSFSHGLSQIGKIGRKKKEKLLDWVRVRKGNFVSKWNVVLQSLSHCELITDEGIRQLALSPCAAEHLAVLELDNCPLITDASLDHLLQACHNLERIELYDCQLITRAGIRRLRVSRNSFWKHIMSQKIVSLKNLFLDSCIVLL